jgi:hypothetical protein
LDLNIQIRPLSLHTNFVKPTLHITFYLEFEMKHFKSISKYPRLGAMVMLAGLTVPLLADRHEAQDDIYETGFERPTFVAGSPLVGTDGWTAPPVLSPDAAVIVAGHSRNGKQSVQVLGADLVHQDFLNQLTNGYYDAIGSYRHPVNYDTGNKQTVRISADVLIKGPETGEENNFFSASIAGRAALSNGDDASVGELAISSDGKVYGYSGNDNVPVFLTSGPARLDGWHNLAIEANFAKQEYSFYIDGDFLGTFDFLPNGGDGPGVEYDGVLLRGSILAYAAPDTQEFKKQDHSAHYDNFSIEVVSDGHDHQK